jgi:hypothetical protein
LAAPDGPDPGGNVDAPELAPGGIGVALKPNLLEVLGDVAEDLAHDRAKEQKGHDHDDRNQGQEQTVLNEGLAFLILPREASKKSADELKHALQVPPFLEDWAEAL